MVPRKIFLRALASAALLLVLAQLVPNGREHTNPPLAAEPVWDGPATRELAKRACFDCHSRETRWPWYSHVAPVSWFVQHDVVEGREQLDLSCWVAGAKGGGEAAQEVLDGSMPPRTYLWTHPDARLTRAERGQLAAGLEQTLRRAGVRGGVDFDDDPEIERLRVRARR